MGKDYGTYVVLFYLCLFLLTSSGRTDSADPVAQFIAATALARTGTLALPFNPMPHHPVLWMQGVSGGYYQTHDLGAPLFMLPIAWASSYLAPAPLATQLREPPLPGRLGIVLSYVPLSATACFFLYRLLTHTYTQRCAFLLSAVFVTSSLFWAYTRSAWNVIGAAVGICALLCFCGHVLSRDRARTRDIVKIAVAFTVVGLFRFSLAPFLLLGVLAFLYQARSCITRWQAGLCLILIGAGLLPNFLYNFVRTGSLLQSGATRHYPLSAGLQGNMAEGLVGLFFAPNRGLLVYAPIFLLLFALPAVWHRVPLLQRRLLACFSLSAVTYTLAVAKMNSWGAPDGWGPRYLVPILPLLFLGVAVVIAACWQRYKGLLCALIGVSALLNLPSVFVNYNLAASRFPDATNVSARVPIQQWAAWRGLLLGLRGRPLPAPAGSATANLDRTQSRTFPDLWLARLIRYSPAGAVAGTVLTLTLLAGAGFSLRHLLLACPPEHPEQTNGKLPAGQNLGNGPRV